MYRRDDPANIYQIEPELPRTRSGTTGLECLRMVDSLYVKQETSLSEGKLLIIKYKIISVRTLAIFGFASEAKFDIYNNQKERIFQAIESEQKILF